MTKTILANTSPAAIPVSYLTFFHSLDDMAKVAGLIVILLQGIYLLIKIIKTARTNAETE